MHLELEGEDAPQRLETAAAAVQPPLTACQAAIIEHLRTPPMTLDAAYAVVCSIEASPLPTGLQADELVAPSSSAACFDVHSAVPSWCAHRVHRCKRCEAINCLRSAPYHNTPIGQGNIRVASLLTQCDSQRARTGRVPSLPVELLEMCVKAYLDGFVKEYGKDTLAAALVQDTSSDRSSSGFRRVPERHAMVMALLHTSRLFRACAGLRLVEHVKQSTMISWGLGGDPVALSDVWTALDSSVAALIRCYMLVGIEGTNQRIDELPQRLCNELLVMNGSLAFDVQFTVFAQEIGGVYTESWSDLEHSTEADVGVTWEWEMIGRGWRECTNKQSEPLDLASVHGTLKTAFVPRPWSRLGKVHQCVVNWARGAAPVDVMVRIDFNGDQRRTEGQSYSFVWTVTKDQFTCSRARPSNPR